MGKFGDLIRKKRSSNGGFRRMIRNVISTPEPATQPSQGGALPAEPDGEGFQAVARSEDLLKVGTYGVGDQTVAVFRVESGLYAVDNACVHEDGPLGEGEVDGHVVTCPYHDWRYDVQTGGCLTDAARSVACYAVRERDGFVWVGERTSPGSRDRGGDHDDGLSMIR